jgi:hypothetical protein
MYARGQMPSRYTVLAQQDPEAQQNQWRFTMIAIHLAMIANNLEPTEPETFAEAMNSPHSEQWMHAMIDEIDSLTRNGTFIPVNLPPGKHTLQGKWVYKLKRGKDGEITRFKARFVVRGFEQKEGIDYHETFASVVKPMSYKMIFAIAAALDLELEQMDVKTAFLYGGVKEEIYVTQPQGFDDKSGKVFRLRKALYGLKQSPRIWYQTLSDFLETLGFKPLNADVGVFIPGTTYIAVYVDDLLIAGPDKEEIRQIKAALSKKFEMTDLGPCQYYLGMSVRRDRRNKAIFLSQRAYVEKVLREFDMWESKPVTTPLSTSKFQPVPDEYKASETTKLWYAKAIGSLMYAMLGTRPGLSDWNDFFNHWHSIMRSSDEQAFDQRVQELEKRYLPQYLEEVGYIKSNWLDPYKKKLVKAWVDQHPHFGNVVTSRVEGIHGLLKSHLKKSTLDLFEAWRAMKHALLNQLSELRSNQVRQQMRIPIELSGSLYSAIRGWISHEALRKVEEQRKRLMKEDLPSCTGTFSRSHGLPCAHILKALQEQGQTLRLEHFHPHWHLSRHGVHQVLLEPRHRSDRIAADSTTSKSQSSTQREPSAFEAVQAAAQPKARPTCSRCHKLGHKMTSKACPQRYEGILYLSSSSAQVEAMPVALSPALSGEARPAAAVSASVSSLQEGEPLEDPSSGLSGHAGSGRDDTSCIVVSIETAASSAVSSAKPSTQGGTSPVASSSTASVAPTLRYDDPQAIYRRYVAARDAWYKAQPRGSVKTNQQYRRALGLPLRYDKASYQWCLDWKQMGKLCTTPTGSRDWSKEEMMAYLDWSKAEDDRVEAQVAAEMESNPFSSRRGMRDIWEAAENDGKEQQELYSA